MKDRLYVHKKTVYMCITFFTNSFVVVIQFQGFLVVFWHSVKEGVWCNWSSMENSPDPAPRALRLLWHKTCAAEARGTAGSGNGWHITDITIWWFGRDVITTSVLICLYVILEIKKRKGEESHQNRTHSSRQHMTQVWQFSLTAFRHNKIVRNSKTCLH